GWDPRLRQPPLGEQLAQVASVGAVGLRAPLAAPAGGNLGRLGQVRDGARFRQRLTHKQPAGAGLDRHLYLSAGETLDPRGYRLAGRVDPPARDLTAVGVKRVEGDLVSVHVVSGYDRHQGLLSSSGFDQPREGSRAEPREALPHAIFRLAPVGETMVGLLSIWWVIAGVVRSGCRRSRGRRAR